MKSSHVEVRWVEVDGDVEDRLGCCHTSNVVDVPVRKEHGVDGQAVVGAERQEGGWRTCGRGIISARRHGKGGERRTPHTT